MATFKLKDKNGVETTYTKSGIKIPNSDGTGYVTFSGGGGNPLVIDPTIAPVAADAGKFCVDGNNKMYRITRSTGTEWHQISGLDTTSSYTGVAYGNDRWVVVGTAGKSYYSTDGINWTAMSGLSTSVNCTDVSFGNGYFACTTNNGVYVSNNGTSWQSKLSTSFNAAAYGNGIFAFARYAQIFYTSNFSDWPASQPRNVEWLDIVYGADKFMIVGDGRYAYYSQDCVTWTSAGNPLQNINSITYGNSYFLGVCNNGGGCYYTGSGWTNLNKMGSKNLLSVTHGNGKFVCVGEAGSSYYASDSSIGTAWSVLPGLNPAKTYNAVGYGDGYFIAVGSDGSIYRTYPADSYIYNPVRYDTFG